MNEFCIQLKLIQQVWGAICIHLKATKQTISYRCLCLSSIACCDDDSQIRSQVRLVCAVLISCFWGVLRRVCHRMCRLLAKNLNSTSSSQLQMKFEIFICSAFHSTSCLSPSPPLSAFLYSFPSHSCIINCYVRMYVCISNVLNKFRLNICPNSALFFCVQNDSHTLVCVCVCVFISDSIL